MRSGEVNSKSGSRAGNGNYGRYWSMTMFHTTNVVAYEFVFLDSQSITANYGDVWRYLGSSLRCLSTDGEGSVRSGYIDSKGGELWYRGERGYVWSATQTDTDLSSPYYFGFYFNTANSSASASLRYTSIPLRCLSTDGEGSSFLQNPRGGRVASRYIS